MEWLATDHLELLKHVLNTLGKNTWYSDFENSCKCTKKTTANNNTKAIGQTFSVLIPDITIYNILKPHTPDLVRCWSCWAESIFHDSIPNLLKVMKPYVADTHFGVREVVIFATKERMIEDLGISIEILSKKLKI